MPQNMSLVFPTAPSNLSELDAAMPCYGCCMLDYGMICQECSRFTATSPSTPPSTPANDFSFSFKFTTSLQNKLSALETPSTPSCFTLTAKQSRWDWTELEAAKPSNKPSRFNWSEVDCPADENAFEKLAASDEDAHLSVSNSESDFGDYNPFSGCAVCSMVPYGAYAPTAIRSKRPKPRSSRLHLQLLGPSSIDSATTRGPRS